MTHDTLELDSLVVGLTIGAKQVKISIDQSVVPNAGPLVKPYSSPLQVEKDRKDLKNEVAMWLNTYMLEIPRDAAIKLQNLLTK